MSDLHDDQRDYLLRLVHTAISEKSGINTADLYIMFSDVVYPTRTKDAIAPEPFAPDPFDILEALQALLTAQEVIMLDRSPNLDKQMYRVR